MKVILLKDINGVGRKFEVKDVSEGYVQNFLLPRKLALVATSSALKKIEADRQKAEVDRKIQNELLEKNLDSLNGSKVTLVGKANEQGHLFATIHKKQVVKAVSDQLNIEIPEEIVEMDANIKNTGSHEIKVSVNNKTYKFEVVVEPEN